jgi:dihydrolipoamide dehydrogenase
MIIVGSGAIEFEFAHLLHNGNSYYCRVRLTSTIEDEDISKQMERSMKKSRCENHDSSSVEKIDTMGGVKAFVKTAKGEVYLTDMLLSAVGIKTNIENIGLEEKWYRY